MLEPALAVNENERISELQALHVLDTPPEERFDRITRVAEAVFNVPIALVSLVDTNRQWFKSCVGLTATETGRDISFCGHAILGDEVFVIEDTLLDPRFADNPLVTGPPNIRFYAGCPIAMPSGNKLGTLCVIDSEPRKFSVKDGELLKDLAQIVIGEFVSQQAATVDALTSIFNRRGFEVLANKALANSRRYGWNCALVYLDLNKFKVINDTYGHAAGDKALITFSSVLGRTMRESDIVARLGGDEFVALLMNASESKARYKVQRIQNEISSVNQTAEFPFELSISYGIVEYDSNKYASLDAMLHAGDEAMYRYKTEHAQAAK